MSISKEDFEKIVAESESIQEVGRKLGYKSHTTAARHAKALAEKYNLELPKIENKPPTFDESNPDFDSNFFAEGHYRSGPQLKSRMLKRGVKDECAIEKCLVKNIWEGSEITLEVDHIDGNVLNNKLENLRLLCPNCHAQTKTYGRKKY